MQVCGARGADAQYPAGGHVVTRFSWGAGDLNLKNTTVYIPNCSLLNIPFFFLPNEESFFTVFAQINHVFGVVPTYRYVLYFIYLQIIIALQRAVY